MTDVEDDEIVGLWKALHKHNVEYIFAGGLAVVFHGYSKSTLDIVIWIKDSAENRMNIKKVFEEVFSVDISNRLTMHFEMQGSVFRTENDFEIEILTDLEGLPQEKLDECFIQSKLETILGIPVRFLHFNDLIKSKEAAGRLKDQIDIES